MNFNEILNELAQKNISDIFVVAGKPLAYEMGGVIKNYNDVILSPDDTVRYINEIYKLAENRELNLLKTCLNDNFSFTIPGLARFRVSSFIQRNTAAAVVRVIPFSVPDYKEMGIPDSIISLTEKKKGLVLVTGSAGSGKSTTLACMINEISKNQKKHIITLEDPIEFTHKHNNSIVSQREIGSDVKDYVSGLKAALRQRPEVILLGEMLDLETISTALTAAETGHMVYSTLHTLGAANTINRILDVFMQHQRNQIANQISMVLEAVVSQQLLPTKDNSLALATEIMTVTPAVRNLIREGKIHQLDNVISSSRESDMISMDTSIYKLYSEGRIEADVAVEYSTNPEMMIKKINK